MNSRGLRRLATDHCALHNQPLPPNYLFPPGGPIGDDLTELDILLAGPTHTPFAKGVWKLHLTIPTTYPQQPPTANFRTPIFHPNVEPQTGGVCVETLKRDWDSKLTLRDVLVTISCLLIQPNPDSALNAEAGALIQENYDAFAHRAELMTSIHANIPRNLVDGVREAQTRGQEEVGGTQTVEAQSRRQSETHNGPLRRTRVTAMQRGTTTTLRRSDGSPSGAPARRRRHGPVSNLEANPFVVQSGNDDVFGASNSTAHDAPKGLAEDDSSMFDADQENDETRSPSKAPASRVATPRRPPGAPIPLGELTLEGPPSDTSEDESEPEYPPSPHKSPVKSPMKARPQRSGHHQSSDHAESSRAAASRIRNITPPVNLFNKPLAEQSPFVDSSFVVTDPSPSPRKQKSSLFTPAATQSSLFPTPKAGGRIFKPRSPSSAEKRREEQRRRDELKERLWELCGRDVRRWNRGDFDGQPFPVKASRW